jgi:hypothetical protein
MVVSKLIRALRSAGVKAAVVRSEALPQVWTEIGWFFTALPTGLQWDWANKTKERWETVATVEEALIRATLWQIADDAKRMVRPRYLTRVK